MSVGKNYKEDSLEGTRQGCLLIGKAYTKKQRAYYRVTCDCGHEYSILRDNLIRKKYQHCNCKGCGIKPGQKYEMLTVLRRIDGKWECRCDCGNICYKTTSDLRRRAHGVKSCGCMRRADKRSVRCDSKTGIPGVTYSESKGKFVAYITKDKKYYYCGTFVSLEDAKEARDRKAKELFQTGDSLCRK